MGVISKNGLFTTKKGTALQTKKVAQVQTGATLLFISIKELP